MSNISNLFWPAFFSLLTVLWLKSIQQVLGAKVPNANLFWLYVFLFLASLMLGLFNFAEYIVKCIRDDTVTGETKMVSAHHALGLVSFTVGFLIILTVCSYGFVPWSQNRSFEEYVKVQNTFIALSPFFGVVFLFTGICWLASLPGIVPN